MGTGRLATLDITSAATDTLFYTIPSNKTSSFSMCFTNRTSDNALVRIAFTTTSSITADEYVAYDVALYPNEIYERNGFILVAGQYVYVRSSITGVTVVAWGYES